MTFKRLNLILMVFLPFIGRAVTAWGATCNPAGGLWSNSATWSNPPDTPNEAVTFINGCAVTLDTAATVGAVTLSSGTLRFSDTVSSTLTVVGGDVTVGTFGVLDMGSASRPIPAGVNAALVLALGSSGGQYGLIVQSGGVFTTHGVVKTPFAAATLPVVAGATQIRIPSSVTNWAVGDRLILGRSSFAASADTRVISGLSLSGAEWLVDLDQPTAAPHGGPGFVVGNLTRNVLVRSSGTAVAQGAAGNTSYIEIQQNADLRHAEFSYLGAVPWGRVSGITGRMRMEGASVHDGLFGAYANTSSGLEIRGSVFHNLMDGINLYRGGGHLVAGNAMFETSNEGYVIWDSSHSVLTDNIAIGTARGLRFIGDSTMNAASGLLVVGAGWCGGNEGTASANAMSQIRCHDSQSGIHDGGTDDHYFHVDVTGVSAGVAFLSAASGTVLGNAYFYGNPGGGVYASDLANDATFIDGALGMDRALVSNDNGSYVNDLYVGNLSGRLYFMNSRIKDAPGSGAMTGAAVVLSPPGSPGVARVSGDWRVTGPLVIDNAQPLYHSGALAPRLIRGTGHSLTVTATHDSRALTQLITVVREGGLWNVYGSSAPGVVLRSFTGDQTAMDVPAGAPQFTMDFDQASPQEDDRIVFGLLSSSQDAGVQKRLFFDSGYTGVNGGKSRLSTAPGVSVVLRGQPGVPVLVDRSSIYYSFVSSGAFTAEHVSFQGLDSQGLQLSGNEGVVLASCTFASLGLTAGNNAYITARDLSSSATFYGLIFGDQQSPAPTSSQFLKNVLVSGNDAGLSWTLQGWSGNYAGPSFEFEMNANNRIQWPIQPPANLVVLRSVGRLDLSWSHPTAPPAAFRQHYRVLASSESPTGPWSVDTTTILTSHALTDLLDDTTYYLEVHTVGTVGLVPAAATLVVRTPDVMAPSAAVGLHALTGAALGELSLEWTSPGDDLGTEILGDGSGYAIQYSTQPPLSVAWSTATAYLFPVSGIVGMGANRTHILSGLAQETTYYARLWIQDPDGNWSAISPDTAEAVPRLGGVTAALGPSAASAEAFARDQVFSFIFSRPMNPAGVRSALRLTMVRNHLGETVNTSVPYGLSPGGLSSSFTLIPSEPLEGNSLYRVSLDTSCADPQGNLLSQAVTDEYVTVMNHSLRNIASAGISRAEFPAGALSADGYLTASSYAGAAASQATRKLVAATEDGLRAPLASSVVDLKVMDAAGAPLSGNFAAPVTVSFPYSDTNEDGLVDGTSPPLRVRTLSIYWLDEEKAVWHRLPSSRVEPGRVVAETPHFTVFALAGAADTDLSAAYAYPVPFRAARGDAEIVFSGLGQDTEVQILTVSGGEVASLRETNGDGVLTWDVRTSDGGPAASGVYLYVLKSGSNVKKGKLVILR
jgi:hypothetical protein